MDLITLIETLESNLTREIVYTNYGATVSYTADSPKTITINDTSHQQTNRLCLLSQENTTNLHISSYDFKKRIKIDISDINTISIT